MLGQTVILKMRVICFNKTMTPCACWELRDGGYLMVIIVVSYRTLSGADNLYSGSWGPTRSAVALALSPLGMFFYFLPKILWIHIEKETNDYREQCIYGPNNGVLEVQTKGPRKTVQTLEEIKKNCHELKPTKAHEVIYAIIC
ncbi:LOW QUALITY PROTEIN: Hypothetical protein PHPALM_14792 [Phytophthora palmivora]|uniref:Uncharacterized protein n=1 Tax=Phytophthora palmivora TaxID=4796 RepID=A0A2P4XTX9_9STRA|nr:LOW QUALITY PROTEIN: Hypothetical protein PHPALM_14792 [Phytophthora palmivora]